MEKYCSNCKYYNNKCRVCFYYESDPIPTYPHWGTRCEKFEVKERTYVNMFVDDMKNNNKTDTDIEAKEKDMVNSPAHYNQGIEAIEYIESHNFNFNLGNAIKYITRCEHKGTKKQDIKKAIWYLNRELSKEK